ncbi:hypothetical protein MMC32_006444 [Xylographa parallela]|nr:hypothetical protein [Xylographa parallela]
MRLSVAVSHFLLLGSWVHALAIPKVDNAKVKETSDADDQVGGQWVEWKGESLPAVDVEVRKVKDTDDLYSDNS